MIIKEIIKNYNLNCTEEEFKNYFNSIDTKKYKEEIEKNIKITINTFDKPYKNHKVENPGNGKYYYILDFGNIVYLQYIVPNVGGNQPLNDDNINEVIEKHKNDIIEEMINNKKLELTIKHFSS